MQGYNGTHTNQYVCDLRNILAEPSILEAKTGDSTEVVRIAADGNIYWKGRLVESDDEFKQAMLDLANALKNGYANG